MEKVKNRSDQVKACSEWEGKLVSAELKVEADGSQSVKVRINNRFVRAGPVQTTPDSYIKRMEKTTFAAMPQAEQIADFLRRCARVEPSPFPVLSGDRKAGHESGGAFHR